MTGIGQWQYNSKGTPYIDRKEALCQTKETFPKLRWHKNEFGDHLKSFLLLKCNMRTEIKI